MGVSGSGKSTVGMALSQRMDIPFYDADDYHPESNIRKMQSGQPLNDDDRLPWLKVLASLIESHQKKEGIILACSALKESYRKMLRINDQVHFIYLKLNQEELVNRMNQRSDHFMPVSLLESQLETLEEPTGAITILGNKPIHALVETIVDKLKAK